LCNKITNVYSKCCCKVRKKVVSFPSFSKTVHKNWLLQKLFVSNVYLETTRTYLRLQLNLVLSKIGLLKKNCVDLEGTVRHGIK